MRFTRLLVLALSFLSANPLLADDGRKLLRHSEPVYPEIARRMHMTGKVEVEVTIAPDGSVRDAKVISGNSMLATAAVAAARNFKYEPGTESTSRIAFEFR
jgi:TonB family protein